MDTSNVIALGTSITAVIALLWQIRQSNNQSKMQTFLTYTQRYQDILVNLPITVESDHFEPSNDVDENQNSLRWMRAYFDLCSEQLYLHDNKLIDSKIWKQWKGGISDSLKKPAFSWAWTEIQENGYYRPELASMIEALRDEKA